MSPSSSPFILFHLIGCKQPFIFKQMECKYYRMLFILLSAIILNIVNGQSRSDYQIPQPTAVVLSRGFRISIPGEQSLSTFVQIIWLKNFLLPQKCEINLIRIEFTILSLFSNIFLKHFFESTANNVD